MRGALMLYVIYLCISRGRTMPLKHVPSSISPELLYALARMGHGDRLCIADGNFPSDAVAAAGKDGKCIGTPIRVFGVTTVDLLADILQLLPIDSYCEDPDRVDSDRARDLQVPAYAAVQAVVAKSSENTVSSAASTGVALVERFEFYAHARSCFCVIQTNDNTPYGNIIVTKGVIFPAAGK